MKFPVTKFVESNINLILFYSEIFQFCGINVRKIV